MRAPTSLASTACPPVGWRAREGSSAYYTWMTNEQRAVRAWLRGHRVAQSTQRAVRASAGARPSIAVAESLAALNAAHEMGIWPGPRSEISERAVQHVRRRWVLVQNRARQAKNR